jgi:hypothetical protein
MLETQSNSRQIPKVQTICASKKYNDILYAYLQCVSERDSINGNRYFSKKDINFSNLGKMFNLSRQTVSTKFKHLMSEELNLVEKISDEKYLLKELPKDYASLIPYKTLKLITDTLSENSVNTYVYLLNRYYANNCKPFKFTLAQVKSAVGICATTRSNDDIITNILFVLQKIGLIRYSLTGEAQESSTFQNVKTMYQIDFLTNTI